MGHPHSAPGVPCPPVPLSPLGSLLGTGLLRGDSVSSGLEGGSACPAFGGCTPSPEPALLLLLCQEGRPHPRPGCVGTPRGTHTPRVAPSFPPRSRIPPTPSRWNPQCQDSASPSPRFSGAPFPRHVPLPATTRGTRCGCDPRDVTRAQFPWMSPQPAFPPESVHPAPASHRFLRHHTSRCIRVLRMQDPELTQN